MHGIACGLLMTLSVGRATAHAAPNDLERLAYQGVSEGLDERTGLDGRDGARLKHRQCARSRSHRPVSRSFSPPAPLPVQRATAVVSHSP